MLTEAKLAHFDFVLISFKLAITTLPDSAAQSVGLGSENLPYLETGMVLGIKLVFKTKN